VTSNDRKGKGGRWLAAAAAAAAAALGNT